MKIGQKFLSTTPNINNEYSENLVPNEIIISLNIYSYPGNKFKINDNGEIIINGTGNLSLQCSNFPIIKIQAAKENSYSIPTIIDYVSQSGGI